MSHLPDEALAARAQSGDRDAERILTHRLWDKAALEARAFPITGVDFEERESICLFALARAIQRYRPGMGAKFLTYAKSVMRRALIDRYREAHQASEVPVSAIVGLDEPVYHGDGEALSLLEVIPGGQDTEAELLHLEHQEELDEAMAKTWPPFRDALKGRSVREIAQANQMSESAVRSLLAAILVIGRHLLTSEDYADLTDMVADASDQPHLIQLFPSRDQAEAIGLEAYRAIRALKCAVIADLIDGYTHDEISARRSVAREAVDALVAAIRAVAQEAA